MASQRGNIEIDPAVTNGNTKVIADLTAPKYKISSEKTLTIESKDDIKKRIGRSTDYGDAIMQAFMKHMGTDYIKGLTNI